MSKFYLALFSFLFFVVNPLFAAETVSPFEEATKLKNSMTQPVINENSINEMLDQVEPQKVYNQQNLEIFNLDEKKAAEKGYLMGRENGLNDIAEQVLENKNQWDVSEELKKTLVANGKAAGEIEKTGCMTIQTAKDAQIANVTKFCEVGVKTIRRCNEDIVDFEIKKVPAVFKEEHHYVCMPNRFCEKKWYLFTSIEGSKDHPNCPVPCRQGYTDKIKIADPSIEIINEQTSNSCKAIEEKGKYCRKISETCINQQPQMHNGLEVKRCWQKELKYECGQDFNNCNSISTECSIINVACKEKDPQGNCLVWNREYNCPNFKGDSNEEKICDIKPLEGFKAENEQNQEFGKVIPELAVFGEIANSRTGDVNNFRYLGGHSKSCRENKINFDLCCSDKDGWGEKLNLTQCKADEVILAKMRSKGLCVYVNKRNKGVFRKDKVFCCYDSVINRIFNQGGKEQLKKGWGSAKHPSCEGFTLEEMQSINYDQIFKSENIQDFINELVVKVKLEIGQLDKLTNELKKQFSQMGEVKNEN